MTLLFEMATMWSTEWKLTSRPEVIFRLLLTKVFFKPHVPTSEWFLKFQLSNILKINFHSNRIRMLRILITF